MASQTFHIQVVSDLHLDINGLTTRAKSAHLITPSAPYLALAGDISELRNWYVILPFLTEMCDKFEKVFYVMGNHEYYSKKFEIPFTKERLLETLRMKIHDVLPNLFILDNEIHYLEKENILIAGCTLWSEVSSGAAEEVVKEMRDYKKIGLLIEENYMNEDKTFTRQRIQRLDVKDTNRLHHESLVFLKDAKEMAAEKSAKLVVVSHHAPLTEGTRSPLVENAKLSEAYATDLSNFISEDSIISGWIFGHTHWCCDFMFHDTRIVSNPLGYMGFEHLAFRRDAVLEINRN